jgi:hypothetical protein
MIETNGNIQLAQENADNVRNSFLYLNSKAASIDPIKSDPPMFELSDLDADAKDIKHMIKAFSRGNGDTIIIGDNSFSTANSNQVRWCIIMGRDSARTTNFIENSVVLGLKCLEYGQAINTSVFLGAYAGSNFNTDYNEVSVNNIFIGFKSGQNFRNGANNSILLGNTNSGLNHLPTIHTILIGVSINVNDFITDDNNVEIPDRTINLGNKIVYMENNDDSYNNVPLKITGNSNTTIKVNGDQIYPLENRTIDSSQKDGIPGQMKFDNTHLYVCIGTNRWKKIPLQNI